MEKKTTRKNKEIKWKKRERKSVIENPPRKEAHGIVEFYRGNEHRKQKTNVQNRETVSIECLTHSHHNRTHWNGSANQTDRTRLWFWPLLQVAVQFDSTSNDYTPK